MDLKYKLEFKKKAEKEFLKINSIDKDKISVKINQLLDENNHKFLDIKKMKGLENEFRLRVGNYRVIYEKYENRLVILIVTVGHRKDVYK